MATCHHVIWPEGMPERAVTTTSALRAILMRTRMQYAFMFPFSKARRIRHATSEGKAIDPQGAETALQVAGAIPPPGGWPKLPDGLAERVAEAMKDDASSSDMVDVRTHSII